MLRGRLWGTIDLVVPRNGEAYSVMPDGAKIYFDFFDPAVVTETWLYEIYFLGHDLSKWFILDVGAYIGDTALYYAKRGAFVVAVEPLPSHYEDMLKNIELNPDLKSKIIPINVAIGSEDGYAEFGYSRSVDCGASMYYYDKHRVRVRLVKLSTLIKELNAKGIDLNKFKFKALKMDCEGCEYDVILNDYEHVKLFDEVYFEYHAFITRIPVEMLLKKLSKDFECKIVSDEDFYKWHRYSRKLLGLVKCVKV